MKGDKRVENVIAERIKKAKLTRAQVKIAEYIIANPELAGRSSSLEVARAAGVSDVSVTRFARAIGYPGFTELKNDLYDRMVERATQGVSRLSLDERLEANRAKFGSDVSREEFLKIQTYNIERTIMQNSEELYDKFANVILNADICFVAGFRGCYGTVHHFSWILSILTGRICRIIDESVGGIDQMQRTTERDCAVFFSASRYYKSDLRLARLAKSHGAAVCLITDSILSPLASCADVVLTAEVRQASFFNSTTAMNAVAEYLLMLLTPCCLDRYRAHVRERDEYTKDLLI